MALQELIFCCNSWKNNSRITVPQQKVKPVKIVTPSLCSRGKQPFYWIIQEVAWGKSSVFQEDLKVQYTWNFFAEPCPINATSDTLSIFIYRGKFKIVEFYQNVLRGENWNFPNYLPLYYLPLQIKFCTEQLSQQNYTMKIKLFGNIIKN